MWVTTSLAASAKYRHMLSQYMEMDVDAAPDERDLDEAEVAALHEIELGMEWFHRAHGHLVAFHHNTGHAMDHLSRAEAHLRESGRDELADTLRDGYLPRGVIDGDRWSYDVLECFQSGLLTDLVDFEGRARHEIADGRRHVAERRQERTWKGRSRRHSNSSES